VVVHPGACGYQEPAHDFRHQPQYRDGQRHVRGRLLDLDDFKGINDEHGHLSGDRALQGVANALRETTRPYDVCVRYGGDEFVVLLASNGARRPSSSAAACRTP
jgi:diguanylate cyclase (GGDEF)-like protein